MNKIDISKPDKDELSSLKIDAWSPWECEPSSFDWEYDSEEWCYVFKGKARIKTEGSEVEINKGDLVKFPKGLKCVWNVLERIEKVYIFK